MYSHVGLGSVAVAMGNQGGSNPNLTTIASDV